jgi:hypothetical protein
MIFENEEGYKIEECRPDHGLERRQHFCGNDRCNGICCIVKAVDIIEDKASA